MKIKTKLFFTGVVGLSLSHIGFSEICGRVKEIKRPQQGNTQIHITDDKGKTFMLMSRAEDFGQLQMAIAAFQFGAEFCGEKNSPNHEWIGSARLKLKPASGWEGK